MDSFGERDDGRPHHADDRILAAPEGVARPLPEWPLTGRESELAALTGWYARSESPALIVSGPAGIGKTRLVREAVRQADGCGGLVHHVSATASAAGIPFGALVDLLPRARPSGRLDLFAAAARTLGERANGRVPLLSVDDAHLLDEASAALVHHLVLTGNARAVLTVRDGTSGPDAIASLGRDERTELLPLPALDEEDVGRCVRHAVRTVRPERREENEVGREAVVDHRVARRLTVLSAGNPLVLRELVRDALHRGHLATHDGLRWRLDETWLAPTLEAAIAVRFERLDPDAREAVELVAFSEPLELDRLEAVTGPEALGRAEAAGLVELATDRRRRQVRLVHPMFREVVRGRTGPLRSRHLCRRLVEAFAEAPRRRMDDTLRLAVLQLDSGLPPDADSLLTGARQAAARFDNGLAVRLADAAVGAGAGVEARLIGAEARAWQGRIDEAADALAELTSLAVDDGDRAAVARARAAVLADGLGRVAEARRVLRDTRVRVTDGRWRELLDSVDVAIGLVGGDVAPATSARRLLADRSTDPRVRLHLLPSVIMATAWSGRPDEAVRLTSAALDDLRDIARDLPYLVQTAEVGMCFARTLGGDLAEAAALASERSRQAMDWRSQELRAPWAYAAGYAELASGRASAAVDLLQEAASLLGENFTLFGLRGRLNCLGMLAEAHATTGDPASARAVLNLHPELTGGDLFLPHHHLGALWTAAAEGDLDGARRIALGLADRGGGHVIYVAEALHALVRLGAPSGAVDGLTGLAETMEGSRVPVYRDHAVAAAAGDGTALDGVAERFDALSARLLACEAAAQAAVAHRRAGDAAAARASASRSRRHAVACGGPVRTPAARLLGESVRLSTREREIAELAAHGMSNRDIATRFTLSTRTVENHLHRVFGKLSVATRADLADALATLPGSP